MNGSIADSIMGFPLTPPNHFFFFNLHSGQCYLIQEIFHFFSAAFQCCGDKKWGDWRPHLAVILSNQGGDPELYQRAIVTMGDTLGKQKLALSPSSPWGSCRSAWNTPFLDPQVLCGAWVGAAGFPLTQEPHTLGTETPGKGVCLSVSWDFCCKPMQTCPRGWAAVGTTSQQLIFHLSQIAQEKELMHATLASCCG